MKKHLFQGRIAVSTSQPDIIVKLPKGFVGYARVRFVAAGAEELKASWVPCEGPELRPQASSTAFADNYGVWFKDEEEKLWERPQGATALVGLTTAADCFAIVDVAGEYEE